MTSLKGFETKTDYERENKATFIKSLHTKRFTCPHVFSLWLKSHQLSDDLDAVFANLPSQFSSRLLITMKTATKKKETDIIETCATYRSDWDYDFNAPDDEDVEAARGLLQTKFQPPKSLTLGRLGILPSEILLDILERLDISSLFRFRWVNHRARCAVSSMRKLAVVVEQAMSTLYMVPRTGVGRYFTLDHVYTVVTRPNCYIRGSFGPFLYLCAV